MAQSGYTPIQLYSSSTATNIPTAGNLSAGELAINTADGKLYFKNSSGVVTLLASSATVAPVTTFSAGTTGFTPNTATSGAITLAGTLLTTNGGTGLASYSAGDLLYYSSGTALSKLTIGATNYVLTAGASAPQYVAQSTLSVGSSTNLVGGANGSLPYQTGSGATTFLAAGTNGYVLTLAGGVPTWASATSGTVTAISVVSANGFTGTSSGGATPALTLATSVTGVVKGNGTAISAATAGTDYVAPSTATTFTATQTFNGTSATEALKVLNIAESASVSATAPTATTNFYVNTGAVQYLTSNTTTNWTLNFAFSSGTSLNTAMATNDAISLTLMVTNSTTAYYPTAFTIDGTSVTPKWQGGTAPTSGNISSIDIYNFVIIKTASATYTVLASQSQFK
jgi:hypothetical protein